MKLLKLLLVIFLVNLTVLPAQKYMVNMPVSEFTAVNMILTRISWSPVTGLFISSKTKTSGGS